MRIRLIRDVHGQDKDGNTFIRTTVRFSRGTAYEWRAGVEFEASEATGRKLIERGDAVAVQPPQSA